MQINDLEEYNCLLSNGKKEGLNGWYWTDGNDVQNAGIWTHAYDNTAVSFFAPDIGCGCTDHPCSAGGDAFLVNIGGDRHFRGNYCNYPSSGMYNFVCEGSI